MTPVRSLLRWLWNLARDPALYVIGFTFYVGLQPRPALRQVALCYLGTVIVIVIVELWRSRADENAGPAQDVVRGIWWGSLLFAIGFAWGASCGYILMWMSRVGAGLEPAGAVLG